MKHEMKVHCVYDKLVPLSDLHPDPANPNQHDADQIKALAKVLRYQGIRKPIIVSKLNGLMVTGHGTLEAIKLNRWTEAPVSLQAFDSEEQQFAHLVADNSLNQWSELDFSKIHQSLENMDGLKLEIDFLGIRNFTLDPPPSEAGKSAGAQTLGGAKVITCPHCKEEFEIDPER